MAVIRVSAALPYFLRLHEGEYQVPAAGGSVWIDPPALLEGVPPRTPVWATFKREDAAAPDRIPRDKDDYATHLLRRVNVLLRWYRQTSHRWEVTELTQAQASPFHFLVVGGAGSEADAWS